MLNICILVFIRVLITNMMLYSLNNVMLLSCVNHITIRLFTVGDGYYNRLWFRLLHISSSSEAWTHDSTGKH